MPAMAHDMGNATPDPVSSTVLATRNPVTFAGVQEAKHSDPVITIQHFAAAGGFIIQANEITLTHDFSPFNPVASRICATAN